MAKRTVTGHDVAAAAGVSQATVSRVLRGDKRVSPETRDRVLEACAGLNYSPNALARAMRSNSTGVVGLVVADIHNPFYCEAIEQFSAEVLRRDKSIVIWNADSDTAAIRAAEERFIDGLVFTAAVPSSELLETAISRGVPVVLFNRGLPSIGCSQVVSANSEGGERAASYFVEHGRRRLAIVHGPEEVSTTTDRSAGFLAAARSLGRDVAPGHRVQTGMQREDGVAAARRLLVSPDPPDAVFCTTDIVAAGFVDGAREVGVDVPDDVWVIGFDDIRVAAWHPYQLTTFAQPLGRMVRKAVSLLDQHIADRSVEPQRVVFDAELIIRRSTANAGAAG